MTYPNTERNESTVGGPPEYPSSQMMPPEYWRKQDSDGPADREDHGQYLTIETAPGVYEKRAVEPGWDKPVSFTNHLAEQGGS